MTKRRMMTVSAAARALGRSPRVVRYHALNERIPGAERQFDRGAWRIPSDWVDAHRPLTAAKTSTGW